METTVNILSSLMGLLGSYTITPNDFHSQVGAVKGMLANDVTGIITTLTDFAVESASVNYTVEAKSDKFTETLKKWASLINVEYNGKIPSGLDALAEEFFKERWQYSSFPVLKIAKWERIDGIMLPTKMFFLDGGSVFAFDKNKDKNIRVVDNYDYYIGNKKEPKNLLEEDVLFSRFGGRWFDKYPTPFLIKRGVYHNYSIIKSLKKQQTKILDQIIPYILLIQKGSEALTLQKNISYNEAELNGVMSDFQGLVDKLSKVGDKIGKSAIRATQFDESIEHIIPDLTTIFKRELFLVTERNILSGLGFVDVVEGISDSRRDSILNPKGFVKDVKSGINDFKQLLTDLFILVKSKNTKNTGYMNNDIYIDSTAVHPFLDEKSKNQIRLAWERGQISNRTYCEVVGEVEYDSEVHRREKEARDGLEATMYPHIVRNDESTLTFEEEQHQKVMPKDEDKNGDPLPDDKVDENQKQDYDIGAEVVLCGAPYETIKQLPKQVKNAMDSSLQNTFMKVFNKAYNQYGNETRAFRVAWGAIKKLAEKGPNGKWVRT